MKNLVRITMFLAIASMAFVNKANAQVSYGANIGLNVANLTEGKLTVGTQTTNLEQGDAVAGLYLSGFVNFSFSKVIGLQPELAFSMQGESGSDGNDSYTHRLNYINIPVLLDIKPVKGLSIFVGPQVGFNVSRAMKVDGITLSGSKYDDLIKLSGFKFNAVDFAAVVGVQYVIMDHFIVGTRASLGLQSIYAADRSGMTISGGENQVFQISVGYKF